MPYMNVDEIEAALDMLAAAHPAVTELIPLPNRTAEGRQSHALRIGPTDAQRASTMVFTGGVHAREWMPPDALVHLAADLLEAHAGGTGLRYGGQRFSADDIRNVIEALQVVLFPCVNPDGRNHTMTPGGDGMWRKNRRRVQPGLGPDCVGVDINRNFDALWDFRRHFAPDSGVSASDDPCDYQVYVGPGAASEAETQNVVALLERFPSTRWFVDVHSHVPGIYYNWGFDANQSSDPTMNFRNPAFDGRRGAPDASYREYIPPKDLQEAEELGRTMNDAITAVTGVPYTLEQSYSIYPTSGASDDYAFSRHLVNGANGKIIGFTIECGRAFQPPWSIAENVIREVCAGVTAMCVARAGVGA